MKKKVQRRPSRSLLRKEGKLHDELPAPRKPGALSEADVLAGCGASPDSSLRLRGESTYDDQTWKSICSEFMLTGAPLNHIVSAHRVSMPTVESWCREDPKLAEDLAACRAKAIGGYWAALRAKALDGDVKALIQTLQWLAPKSFGEARHVVTVLDKQDMGQAETVEVTSFDQAKKILAAVIDAETEEDDEA